jgi:ectoine hydroxylase-related dioxygenase (phytanoyl-CoA dioxygenase family)
MNITDADIKKFRKQGYWLSGDMLSPASLQELHYGIRRLQSNQRDHDLPGGLSENSAARSDAPVNQLRFPSLLIREISNFLKMAPIWEVAGKLTETDQIRLFHDQLVVKQKQIASKSSIVGWHTDKSYWRSCTSDSMVTVWIPLQDVTVENGCLWMLPGSHLWSNQAATRGFHDSGKIGFAAKFRDHDGPTDPVPLVMKRGQFSVHHCKVIHASGQNSHGCPRLAYVVHLQDKCNKHLKSTDRSTSASHFVDRFCRWREDHVPDYRDPNIFPVLWEQKIHPAASKKKP